MIAQDHITEWRTHAPWPQDLQVEQDLVISRGLVEIFSRPALAEALAFRGGTALYKLHVRPAARYSEDIDLVQVSAGPIGPVVDELRTMLSPWLGEPRRKFNDGRATLTYSFAAEALPGVDLRLKLEINTREHFAVYGLRRHSMAVDSSWFTGVAEVTTYSLEELLATKLRALYQRKKGRDLFDLALALERPDVDPERVLFAFQRYMAAEGRSVTRTQLERNLADKRQDSRFTADLAPLLAHGYAWDLDAGIERVLVKLVALLPG